MEWKLDSNNNHTIIINKQDLMNLKHSKLEGIIKYINEFVHIPCLIEISQNGDSIKGLSFKIDKHIKYILKIRPELYERLSEGYKQEIFLNKYKETLTLLVE